MEAVLKFESKRNGKHPILVWPIRRRFDWITMGVKMEESSSRWRRMWAFKPLVHRGHRPCYATQLISVSSRSQINQRDTSDPASYSLWLSCRPYVTLFCKVANEVSLRSKRRTLSFRIISIKDNSCREYNGTCMYVVNMTEKWKYIRAHRFLYRGCWAATTYLSAPTISFWGTAWVQRYWDNRFAHTNNERGDHHVSYR